MISQYLSLGCDPDIQEIESVSGNCAQHIDSFEFVPTSWLMMWLANPSSCGPIETKHFLCLHENLDIDKLHEVKLCNPHTLNKLYNEYGGGEGPRLNSQKLC